MNPDDRLRTTPLAGEAGPVHPAGPHGRFQERSVVIGPRAAAVARTADVAAGRWGVWVVLAALALCLVALANGYVLVFPDTGTYVRQALWLEADVDRPPFYSLALVPVHLGLSLWPVVLVQNLLACYVVSRALRIAFPTMSPTRFVLVLVAAAVLTSLPWFSNQVMPDIFTPLLVLLIFCICFGWESLARAERVLMPLLLLGMVAVHQANAPLALAVLAAALLAGWKQRAPRIAQARRALMVLGPTALALLAQSAYGYALTGTVTPSPYGPVFMLARLLDDGPARRYLEERCPGAGHLLCRYRHQIPADHNRFLWKPESPLRKLRETLGLRGLLGEASAIVHGTVAAYPTEVLGHAVRNAVGQFFSATTTDEDCPCLGSKAEDVVATFFPAEHEAYRGSLQNRGTLPWETLGSIHSVVLAGVAGLLLLLLLHGRHSLTPTAASLLALIVVACVANAALTGALSGIAHRYQARIVWLLPVFVFALLAARTPPATLPRPAAQAARDAARKDTGFRRAILAP
jgi:hypothetical protein